MISHRTTRLVGGDSLSLSPKINFFSVVLWLFFLDRNEKYLYSLAAPANVQSSLCTRDKEQSL